MRIFEAIGAFVSVAALAALLQLASLPAASQTPDPRIGKVDLVISLTRALVRGVDECFNPSHTKANNEVKNRLSKLEGTALRAKDSLTSGDARKLAQTAAELRAQWEAFSDKAPLAARFYCATQRECMELGFEGNPNYPHCQPVNGNRRGNIQFIQFQQLLGVLPQLVNDLSRQT